ncbi:aspartate aminotransferase family protein [Geminicoccaceae bacterium 1502E]|nr:aspartate aminotransferase family protein [Geminicoccaceae bacterium 1502E]
MKNASIPSLLPVYQRIDILFERGEGAWLWDKKGRRYLDCGSGIAVNGLGHAHPHLVQALKDQAEKVWHISNLFRIEQMEKVADRLVANTFADTVFFCNSGAEAVEACIKMARRFWFAAGQPERNRIITFEGAFHGRTLATVSAAKAKKLTEGFAPLLDGFDQVPFGDEEALRAAITERTGAIMVEPVQGEGGIRPVPAEALRLLREICDEHDLLLIFDEVQSGMGRTGTLFAHQLAGVAPDIMAAAKGLGGGFPIGACLATARAASGMTTSSHGSTFGGNPLACAVANAVLDVTLEEGFLEEVRAKGAYFRGKLEELAARHPEQIQEVRGEGLMLGVKTGMPNTEFAARLRELGMITVPAGENVLRLLPPLVITREEIDTACALLGEACQAKAA